MHNEENCREAEYYLINPLGGLGEKGDWGSGLPPHLCMYVCKCMYGYCVYTYVCTYIHDTVLLITLYTYSKPWAYFFASSSPSSSLIYYI